VSATDGKIVPPKRGEMKRSMEALIHHFKLYTEGYRVPEGEVYAAVEAPKGEFGVYLVSDGVQQALPLQDPGAGLRASAGHGFHLQGAPAGRCVGGILGSLDIVFGEVDR
jgi:NADH-quinone oxidoreductase subunit D